MILPSWTGRRSRDVRSPAVNAFYHIRSTVIPDMVRSTTFGADFVVRRFAAFVRYVTRECSMNSVHFRIDDQEYVDVRY